MKVSQMLALAALAANTLFPTFLAGQGNKVTLNPIWKSDLKTFIENSPVLVALPGEKESRIVVAGREDLIMLDKNGQEVWRYRSPGRYMMSPSALERDGKPPLIFATDNQGNVRCHAYDGKVKWEYRLNAPCSWSAPAVADLKEDGHFAIIQGDETGHATAIDADSGQLIWKSALKGMPSSPAIGDLDGIKGAEIAYLSTEGILTVFHADGSLFWQTQPGGISQTWGTSSPVLFKRSDGASSLFVATGDGKVICYSGEGKVLWSAHVNGPVASTLSAGDLNQDGVTDLILITQLGVIYRFTEDGKQLWNIDMQGRTLGSGALIDLNNDGLQEYLFCTQDGHLQALDDQGKTLFDYVFNHRTINETPTFGEIVSSKSGLEMTLTGGESGLTYCFSTSATEKSLRQWISAGGKSTRTNAFGSDVADRKLGMVPENLAWDQLYQGEDIVFNLFNPEVTQDYLIAEVTCRYPDGNVQSVNSKLTGNKSKLFLPFGGKSPGAYQFSWQVASKQGKILLQQERTVYYTPYQNEITS
ncbi:MAG: PQQ-binding-like beta-propeller repeat protein, partial [Marinilabiliales bacterium]|nr:PQQ-binding-like beta-propeller repeat protein [Marinilabiliales bacterium]